MVFGGRQYTRSGDDTWTWDGSDWTPRAAAATPSARYSPATTYDSASARCLLFGGLTDAGSALGDFWHWDGTAWQVLNVPGPPARGGAAMVFDATRQVVVLFGGLDAWVGLLGDTWEWDGARWAQRAPAVAPSPRAMPGMAYDPDRGRTLLFGGYGHLRDTWAWDGARWSPVDSGTVPPSMENTSMFFDGARSEVVLTGTSWRSTNRELQAWAHDGVEWRLLEVFNEASLAVGRSCRAVLDAAADRILIHDDEQVHVLTRRPARVVALAAPCGSPAPRLATRTRPRVGEPAFGLEVATTPGALVLLGLSNTTTTIPIGSGCTLILGPGLLTVLSTADGRGLASAPLPLLPILRGRTIVAQAGVLLPGGTVALTNGLAITVGD